MLVSHSRRRFCIGSGGFLSLIAVGLARAAQAPELIGVLSTGHNDDPTYVALEDRLTSAIPRFAQRFKLTKREGAPPGKQPVTQADELLSMHPKILICMDLTAALLAVSRRGERDIPVVFLAHDDPLKYGLIQSYAHPGNNITGVTTFRCVDGKMIEIMVKAFPGRKRFGYLLDASVDDRECTRLAEEAAARRGIQLIPINIAVSGFAEKALATLKALRLEAIVAPASTPLWQQRDIFVEQLNGLEIPVVYENEVFLRAGGLMFYGPVRSTAMAQLASGVSKIVMGESAGDLPVEQPTLFELVINLRAPHFAQFGISPSTLRRADRILQ
jgi:putative ABC transport system substrate-binding protein